MTLFEISRLYEEALANAVDEETGEIISDEAFELFSAIAEERDIKRESVALYIKNLSAEAEAVKAEKLAMAKRQQSLENRRDWLKIYLFALLDGEAFRTAKVAVSYRKSEVVEIADGAEIPDDYLVFAEPKPNKTELKKALKAGQKFDGISLVEKQNIQIK